MNPNLPSSITKGDSYAILGTLTANGPSGANYFCGSDRDGVVSNISELTTIGTHKVYCTASTGAKVNKIADTYITLTYEPYTATNLITNGSFENSFSNCYNTCPIHSNSKSLYGSKSIYINTYEGVPEIAVIPSSVNLIKDHQYYYFVNAYTESYNQSYMITFYVANLGYISETHKESSWKKISQISTASSTQNISNIRIGKAFNHTDSIWQAYIDGVGLIDLTKTFGLGNEPDKEWCDKHIDYFDGTTTIYK